MSRLVSIYHIQVSLTYIALNGFPSLPSLFQTEGSFFPRTSLSVSFRVDSHPCESGKAKKEVPARKRGLLPGSGGKPSMLLSRNRLQVHRGGVEVQNLFFLSSRVHS